MPEIGWAHKHESAELRSLKMNLANTQRQTNNESANFANAHTNHDSSVGME